MHQLFGLSLELLKVGLGDELDQLVVVLIQVGEDVEQMLDVIPQRHQRVAHALHEGFVDLQKATRVVDGGQCSPLLREGAVPFVLQPGVQLVDDPVIGSVKRVDFALANVGEKTDAVLAVRLAAHDLAHAVGIEGARKLLRLGAGHLSPAGNHLLGFVRGIANRDEVHRVEGMQQFELRIGLAGGVGLDSAFFVLVSLEFDLVTDIELLLGVERPAGKQAVGKILVAIHAVLLEISKDALCVRLFCRQAVEHEGGIKNRADHRASSFCRWALNSPASVSSV